MNTLYKGFTISVSEVSSTLGRFFVGEHVPNVGFLDADWCRDDGYPTLNHAKGAITKYLAGMLATSPKAASPAKAADEPKADKTSVSFDELCSDLSQEAAEANIKWTRQHNAKGYPIAANPATAHVYAEMDYYGMDRTRDTRSRNQREGRYWGKVASKETRGKQGKGSGWLCSVGSMKKTRKQRNEAKITFRNEFLDRA